MFFLGQLLRNTGTISESCRFGERIYVDFQYFVCIYIIKNKFVKFMQYCAFILHYDSPLTGTNDIQLGTICAHLYLRPSSRIGHLHIYCLTSLRAQGTSCHWLIADREVRRMRAQSSNSPPSGCDVLAVDVLALTKWTICTMLFKTIIVLFSL